MKKIALLALAATMLLAGNASAGTQYWDFNDGLQGWTLGGTHPVKQWVPNDPYTGTGGIWLPGDGSPTNGQGTSYAWINVPETNSFQFSAKVSWTAANRLQASGIGYHATAAGGNPWTVSAWYEGRAHNRSDMRFRDTRAVQSGNFDIPNLINNEFNQFFDLGHVILTIDYNYTEPGKILLGFEALNYMPKSLVNPTLVTRGDVGIDPNTGTFWTIDAIRLGGEYAWSQSYFDDVYFRSPDIADPVPEPASMVLAGLGLAALAGLRRKK